MEIVDETSLYVTLFLTHGASADFNERFPYQLYSLLLPSLKQNVPIHSFIHSFIH